MDKAPDAFRTISEVADDLDVPQHVLRFWESRFSQIRPMKRAGGRRYYRADDVDLLRGIRHLLYGEGYTIRGVQRILKDQGVTFVQQAWRGGAVPPPGDEDMADNAAAAESAETQRGRNLRDLLPARGESASNLERREPRLDRVQARKSRTVPPPESDDANAAHTASVLAREDLRKLQAVLHELGECRRLIDSALAEGRQG
ncbi:MAG: MerR family transcriptional regulator [Xanthobacteraceae bacterium]